jgi:hypothetical protein
MYKQVVGVLVMLFALSLFALYTSTTAEAKSDNRFKSYDMEFLLEHSKICLETTTEQVEKYYANKKGKITPLGYRWSRGEFLCQH